MAPGGAGLAASLAASLAAGFAAGGWRGWRLCVAAGVMTGANAAQEEGADGEDADEEQKGFEDEVDEVVVSMVPEMRTVVAMPW
jgi:hypothetical protein